MLSSPQWQDRASGAHRLPEEQTAEAAGRNSRQGARPTPGDEPLSPECRVCSVELACGEIRAGESLSLSP